METIDKATITEYVIMDDTSATPDVMFYRVTIYTCPHSGEQSIRITDNEYNEIEDVRAWNLVYRHMITTGAYAPVVMLPH